MEISNGESTRHSDLNFDNFNAQVHDMDFNFDAPEMPAIGIDQVTEAPETQAGGTPSVTPSFQKQKVGVYCRQSLCNLIIYAIPNRHPGKVRNRLDHYRHILKPECRECTFRTAIHNSSDADAEPCYFLFSPIIISRY